MEQEVAEASRSLIQYINRRNWKLGRRRVCNIDRWDFNQLALIVATHDT